MHNCKTHTQTHRHTELVRTYVNAIERFILKGLGILGLSISSQFFELEWQEEDEDEATEQADEETVPSVSPSSSSSLLIA